MISPLLLSSTFAACFAFIHSDSMFDTHRKREFENADVPLFPFRWRIMSPQGFLFTFLTQKNRAHLFKRTISPHEEEEQKRNVWCDAFSRIERQNGLSPHLLRIRGVQTVSHFESGVFFSQTERKLSQKKRHHHDRDDQPWAWLKNNHSRPIPSHLRRANDRRRRGTDFISSTYEIEMTLLH